MRATQSPIGLIALFYNFCSKQKVNNLVRVPAAKATPSPFSLQPETLEGPIPFFCGGNEMFYGGRSWELLHRFEYFLCKMKNHPPPPSPSCHFTRPKHLCFIATLCHFDAMYLFCKLLQIKSVGPEARPFFFTLPVFQVVNINKSY